jgi:hypothetical protein
MADTTYNVKTVYTADTHQAASGLDRLGGMFDRIGKLLSGLKSILFGLPTLIVAAFATGAIGAFLGRVMEVGGAAETTRLSIAGMVNAQMFATAAQPLGDLDAALLGTDAIVQRMRVHAQRLPGTFDELRTVFQGSLSGGIAAGRNLLQIEAQAARFMAVTKTLGVDSEQAGRDMTLMMEGRAGAQVASFSRLRPLIGKTAQEFNAMSAPQRWEAITRALAGFGPMIDAYEHSWDAVSSTTKDHLEGLLRVGSAPLFDEAKQALRDLNGWLERNHDRVEAFARTVGRGLAEAFSRVVEIAKERGPVLARLGQSPLLRRLAGAAAGLASGASLGSVASTSRGADGRATAVAAGAGVGLALGVPALGLAFAALLEFATHTKAVDVVLASLAASGHAVLALAPDAQRGVELASTGAGSAAASVLPGAFSGLAVVVQTAVDYFHTLMRVLDPYIVMLGSYLAPVFASLGRVGAALGGSLGGFLRILAMLVVFNLRTLLPVFERVAGVLASVLDAVLRALAWFLEHLSAVFNKLIELLNRIPGVRLESPGGLAAPGLSLSGGDAPDGDGFHRLEGMMGFDRRQSDALGVLLRRSTGVTPARGDTHVTNHVQVHQTIEQADDPDRVLIATREAVIQAMLHPVQSASAGVER